MKRKDFENTQWDVREWSVEQKTVFQKKLFALGFGWTVRSAKSVRFIGADLYFLSTSGFIRWGGSCNSFTGAKTWTDFLPEVVTNETTKTHFVGGEIASRNPPGLGVCSRYFPALAMSLYEHNLKHAEPKELPIPKWEDLKPGMRFLDGEGDVCTILSTDFNAQYPYVHYKLGPEGGTAYKTKLHYPRHKSIPGCSWTQYLGYTEGEEPKESYSDIPNPDSLAEPDCGCSDTYAGFIPGCETHDPYKIWEREKQIVQEARKEKEFEQWKAENSNEVWLHKLAERDDKPLTRITYENER